uniref:cytochrome c-type biogenesis CcmF C-terminal domain-containing protein n=1 Tax=Pseudomonas aeruginosa TaxID=287 RepID=UPI001E4B2097
VIGLMMALWVLIFALMAVHERATHRHGFWRGLRTLTRSQWGMVLGHVGVAVTVIGITFSQNYRVRRRRWLRTRRRLRRRVLAPA